MPRWCGRPRPFGPPSLRARSSQAVVAGAPAADQKEKVIRRVVGVHAVRNCVAEELDVLFWQTVRNLKKRCDVRTVAGVCDGASVNRLFQKMNTSGQGRGTPNAFVTVSAPTRSFAPSLPLSLAPSLPRSLG
eukprot:3030530-Prymnesium_polylepis.1